MPNIFSDLQAQTFKDFEMVFVNDGGGNRQLSIIQKFVQEDARAVVIDKPNGGVSSARNAGMDAAHGEWVVFVDPDDRVKDYFLQSLFDSVEESNSPLGIGGFTQVETRIGSRAEFLLPHNAKDGLLAEWYPQCMGYVRSVLWNKIYRLSFLRDHHLRLDERITFAEDFYFNLQVYLHVDTVGIVTDCGYQYMVTGESATNRYHAHLKEFMEMGDEGEANLLMRFGKSKEELAAKALEKSADRAFFYIINYYKKGSPLSFSDKVKAIQREVLDDNRLMQNIRIRGSESLNVNVRLCSFLLGTGKAWLVAAVFTLLFFLKNRFKRLFLWYDVHLSGKHR